MALQAGAQDRLLPALLDRLNDPAKPLAADAPQVDAQGVLNKAQLRRAVLRDLRWLFNATQGLTPDETEQAPEVARSVLNFGLPALAGQRASQLDVSELEQAIEQAIRRYEPRLLPASVRVRALEVDSVLETHNLIEFEIHGQLWAQPVPIEVLMRTRMDLEAGQVDVLDAHASSHLPHKGAR